MCQKQQRPNGTWGRNNMNYLPEIVLNRNFERYRSSLTNVWVDESIWNLQSDSEIWIFKIAPLIYDISPRQDFGAFRAPLYSVLCSDGTTTKPVHIYGHRDFIWFSNYKNRPTLEIRLYLGPVGAILGPFTETLWCPRSKWPSQCTPMAPELKDVLRITTTGPVVTEIWPGLSNHNPLPKPMLTKQPDTILCHKATMG